MARSKKSETTSETKRKPTIHQDESAKVEPLTDEQLQTLFFSHKRILKGLIASKKLAYEAVTAAFKQAAADGISRKEIEIAIRMEQEDGEEEAKAEFARLERVGRWMGVPLGTQADLFARDWREEGKRAALDDKPADPPLNLGNDDFQAWLSGHAEGRTALNEMRAKKFAPLGTEPSTATVQ